MSLEPTILLLYEVGLLIIVSAVVSGLFNRVKLPGLIGAIMVGLFIGGPGGLGLVTDLTTINVLAVLGVVLLLFMTGLEFEVSAFWKTGKKAFFLTTCGVVLSLLVGYGIGLGLGWPFAASFLLGAVLGPSGTSVIAALLSAKNQTGTEGGSTLLTACMIDDVQGVIILTISYGLILSGLFSVVDVVRVSLVSTLFIVGSIVLGSRLLPTLINRVEQVVPEETLFAILLGLGLMFAFVATLVGLAAITGAFIIGAIIPYKTVGEKLSQRLRMMKDIFAAIFFTSIGLSIDPFSILLLLPIALLILCFGLGARLGGGLLGGRLAGLRGKILFTLALGLAIRAEMSLIIAREAVALGILGTEFLALTTTVVIGSILIVMPLFAHMSKTVVRDLPT